MENIEKVERLRERANVSYEEAKKALEENNWDLLDAMVSLERQGKTKSPDQATYSTSYEQQEEIVSVQEKVGGTGSEKNGKDKGRKNRAPLRNLIRRGIRICLDNSFCVERDGDEIFRIPVIALVIVIFAWKAALPIALVALLFGCRYRFEGRDELDKVNEFMENAGNAAETLKEGFQDSFAERSEKREQE